MRLPKSNRRVICVKCKTPIDLSEMSLVDQANLLESDEPVHLTSCESANQTDKYFSLAMRFDD